MRMEKIVEGDEILVSAMAGSDFSKERLQEQFTSNLSDDQVMGLATEFADVFALGPSEMGSTDLVTHSIDTGDSPPIKQPARRIPFALRGTVEEMVEKKVKES